jgi:hypothetical protein
VQRVSDIKVLGTRKETFEEGWGAAQRGERLEGEGVGRKDASLL